MASQVPLGPSVSVVHGAVTLAWNESVMVSSQSYITIVCTACMVCPKVMPGGHIRASSNLTFSGCLLPTIRANLSPMLNSVLDVFDYFLAQAYYKCYRDASSRLWHNKMFQLQGLPCPRLVDWVGQSPSMRSICMLWMQQACFTQVMSSMTNITTKSLIIHAIQVHWMSKTCLQRYS